MQKLGKWTKLENDSYGYEVRPMNRTENISKGNLTLIAIAVVKLFYVVIVVCFVVELHDIDLRSEWVSIYSKPYILTLLTVQQRSI